MGTRHPQHRATQIDPPDRGAIGAHKHRDFVGNRGERSCFFQRCYERAIEGSRAHCPLTRQVKVFPPPLDFKSHGQPVTEASQGIRMAAEHLRIQRLIRGGDYEPHPFKCTVPRQDCHSAILWTTRRLAAPFWQVRRLIALSGSLRRAGKPPPIRESRLVSRGWWYSDIRVAGNDSGSGCRLCEAVLSGPSPSVRTFKIRSSRWRPAYTARTFIERNSRKRVDISLATSVGSLR